MDDLEMTELCAEAMGWDDKAKRYGMKIDPLHDDAQALALVKKFDLCIQPPSVSGKTGGKWHAWLHKKPNHTGVDTDLNRAIVECVARMQVAT